MIVGEDLILGSDDEKAISKHWTLFFQMHQDICAQSIFLLISLDTLLSKFVYLKQIAAPF